MNTSNSRMGDGADSVLTSAVSKVKRHILPLFVIMFIVNYIDRVNIGFVRSHMEHDLGIGAAAYGFGAGLFFIGYALFEDIKVGLFNSIPWLLSIVGMYTFATMSAKWKRQRAWVASALLIAAAGMFMSTTGSLIFAFAAIIVFAACNTPKPGKTPADIPPATAAHS